MTELSIIPECFVDTKVAEIISQASRKYNHQHGCGDVARTLKKYEGQIALGIVDQDLNKGPQARYFSEFTIIREENNLILKRHHTHKQYLVLVCPDMEGWLMNDALAVGIDPAHDYYNLPAGLRDFKAISKTQDIDRNIGFIRFVKALLRADAPSLVTLRSWINLFKTDRLDYMIHHRNLDI